MQAITAPRGLIADIITPFTKGGAIDGPGLQRLLNHVAPHAQAVFLASPHTGEGKSLHTEQRVELLEQAIPAMAQNPIPILIWVTRDDEAGSRHTTIALKEVIEKRRYTGDVFWVDTPLYYHSNRGLPDLYRALCSVVGRPYILYNDPGFINGLSGPLKRNNIRTAVLKELVSLEGITGLIFSGSLDRVNNYHKACRGRPHFRIYDGEESHFLDNPSTSGVVSAGANLAPKSWEKIIQSSLDLSAHKKGYPDHLQQIWVLGDYLRSMRDIYNSRATAPILKEILSDMGIIETPACTFQVEDTKESKSRLRDLMMGFGDYPGEAKVPKV